MTEICVRKAIESDITVLRQLEQELIDFERPFDRYMRNADVIYYDLNGLVSSAESIVYLVEIESRVVASGYGQIRKSKPFIVSEHYCYLGFIYVKPDFRGRGVSQQILEKLIEWAKLRGVNHFQLDVYSENTAAISAYEKFGFKARSVNMEIML